MGDEELSLFELAFILKIPVYKLLKEMPYEEMLCWFSYLEARPEGWRDDLRTSYLLQAQGVKESPAKIFPSLKAITTKSSSQGTLIDSLKGSAMFMMMQKARGGDKLDVF